MTELVQVVVDLGVVDVAAARAELPHDRLAELALLHRREVRLRLIAEVWQALRRVQRYRLADRRGTADRRERRARERHCRRGGNHLPKRRSAWCGHERRSVKGWC